MHRFAELTTREKEVLGWIREGKSNGEIAAILGLSVRTVTTHVGRILSKLHVENRTAAALLFDEFTRSGSKKSAPGRVPGNGAGRDGCDGPLLAD